MKRLRRVEPTCTPTFAAGELHKLPEGLKFAILVCQQLGIDDVVRYEIGFSPVSVPGVVGTVRSSILRLSTGGILANNHVSTSMP